MRNLRDRWASIVMITLWEFVREKIGFSKAPIGKITQFFAVSPVGRRAFGVAPTTDRPARMG